MHRWRILQLLCIAVVMAAMISACSSDDDDEDGMMDPGDGNSDTEAPEVVQVFPPDGQMEMTPGEPIMIQFNEPMDPASANGQISMTHGNVLDFYWSGDAILNIDHEGWPDATQVAVTMGTGLADAAGNQLAAPLTLTYWTMANELAVLDHTPAAGAADINRATFIDLLFSDPMIPTTFATGITINDDTKALYSFTVESVDDYRYRLRSDDALAANRLITVNIGTEVQSAHGRYLPEPVEFTFTTGDLLDDTPPTIVSFDPPSGSIMPDDQGSVTIVFSEPINASDFTPRSMNGQFAWLLSQSPGLPEWNMDLTQLTVLLPADLPAGLPLEAVFADYADVNGLVQTDETVWTCSVAGTADPYPVWDGRRWTTEGDWADGVIGNSTPTDSGFESVWYEFNARATAGHWDRAEYRDEYFTLDYYEIQAVVASGVNLIGFAEDDEGNGDFAVFFVNNPLTFAEFPFVAGNSWSTSASVTLPDGIVDVTVVGEVTGQVDLPYDFDDFEIVWTDVWRVELLVDLSSGGTAVSDDQSVFWYAPGVGVVRESYHEENLLDGYWYEYDRWLSIELD